MSNFDDFDFDGAMQELDDRQHLTEDIDNGMVQVRSPEQPAGYRDPLMAEFDTLRAAARRAGVSDEFYQLVEAKLSRNQQQNAEAGFVGNPPSASGQILGNNVSLTSDLVIAIKPLVRWQGLETETMPVTAQIGLVTPLANNGSLVVRPFVYVRFGTYGRNHLAEVDVGTGRQFTVNASMIEIEAALEAEATANAAQVNIGGCLSFRPAMRTSPLIRTRYIDSQAQGAGSAVTVTVPPFAVGLLPVQMSDGATPGVVQLDFLDSANVIRYSLTIPNGSQTASIPLTGDIVQIKVTTTSVTTQHVRLPFELSI